MSISPISDSKFLESLKDGFIVFGASAVPVNGFNGVSAVSCKYNCSTLEAISLIYRGTIYKAPRSIANFTTGLRPYTIKELLRFGAKTHGITSFKPLLENRFRHDQLGTLKASLIFSGVLASFEMAIQPIDTWCLQDQAAQKRSQFRAAYVGAGANGFRQFKTWMAFSYTEAYFSRYFRENTTINPSSPCGIMVNAFPVGFSVTILCHADHRLKNHLQINNQTTVSAKKNRESRYVRAFKEIIQEQGVRGLFRGLASKGFSNVVLAGGALFLLNKGRIKNKEENSGKK